MSRSLNSGICICALMLAACGDEGGPSRVNGATGTMAGAQISTWATVEDGQVTELGVTIPRATINNASAAEDLELEFPQTVKDQTFFDHLGIDYNPQGHGPPPYLVPHFDIHFYGISEATQKAIDCSAEPMPATAAIPAPYIIPGTGPEPSGTCVPDMGVHAINPTSPELDQSAPQPFTYTMIIGYHAGHVAFFEPMVTQEYLKQGKSFESTINRPGDVGPVTRWPRRATGVYDSQQQAYHIVLSSFE